MSEELVGKRVRIKPGKICSRSDIVTPQETKILEISNPRITPKVKYKVNVKVEFDSSKIWTTWLYRDQFEVIEDEEENQLLCEMEDGNKVYFAYDRCDYVQLEKYQRSMVTDELEDEPITVEIYPKEFLIKALDEVE